jgi:hypothetical protein
MTHHTASSFWTCYYTLLQDIRNQADKSFEGMDADDGILWFWIGTHAEYNRLIARQRKQ